MSEIDTTAVRFASIDAASCRNDAARVPLARASVAPEHAHLTRAIGRGCHVPLPGLEKDALLSLHLPEQVPISWVDSVVLAGSFGAVEFAQGVRLMRALSGIDLGAEPGGATDERGAWLQAALIGRLAGTPFAFADRIIDALPANATASSTLRVSLRTGRHALVTYARASAAAWLDLLARTTWTRDQWPAAACLSLPFESAIRIARHTLPAAALRMLAAGDIILPASPLFMCNGEGSIQLGGLHARVRYRAPGALEIIAKEGKLESQELDGKVAHAPGEELVDGSSMPAEQSNALAALDTLPITLDFELGQVRMSLGEMRALGVGAILPLAGGSPASIAIRSAGHVLGRGEVVDVNGQLGIRVIQWGSPS